MSKKDDLVFATLASGETVLAKEVGIGDGFSCQPLRYGNEKAANEKVGKVKDQLAAEGRGASVVKSGERFLVLVCDLYPSNLADSNITQDHYQPTSEIKTPTQVEVETEAGLLPIGQYLTDSAIYHPSVDSALVGKKVRVTKTGPPTIEMSKADDLAPFKKTSGFIARFGTSAEEVRKQLEAMSKAMSRAQARLNKRQFATTSGERCNPRNRHNHGHKGQTDEKYYYVG